MIKLKRKNDRTDYGCPYRVYIDNNLFCEIKNDEEIGFEISKGTHTLQVRGPHFKSEIVKFEVDDDEFLSFICYPMYTNGKASKFMYKVLSNKIGIALKKNSDFYL